MKTKIYYEIQDNERWVSNYYKTKLEDTKQKVEELSMCKTFKDTIYFSINKVEIEIFEDEMYMFRKEIATYAKDSKTWNITK